MKKKKNNHYVTRAELIAELIKYRRQYFEWKEKGGERPVISEELGRMIWKIAHKFAGHRKFARVTICTKEEMIADGIETCLKYMHNFDPEKSSNPFAYITTILYYAFLQRIKTDVKKHEIEIKYYEQVIYPALNLQDKKKTQCNK